MGPTQRKQPFRKEDDVARRTALAFAKDDGGRSEAGFRGDTGDCVTRAIAIAGELPYKVVYDELNERAKAAKSGKRERPSNSRTGVSRKIYEPYLFDLGFVWRPTMGIGTGCRVHLAVGELPDGQVIAAVSGHLSAVVNGVVRDNHDPTRGGTRCVYGYYEKIAQ